MDIRRFAFVRKLQAALRCITCDRRGLLNEVAHLRERIEIATHCFWSARRELECTADERDQWRERAAMLEREVDETRERGEGRRQPPKALPHFSLGQVLSGTVTEVERGLYVSIDGLDWLVGAPELSWGDVRRPSELVSLGQTVSVKLLSTPAHSQHPLLVLV